MSTTQVVVIGAGPGGYAAAFYAADLGLQVALVDPEANPGGVCLYRGCIPSKALLHVAALINEAQHAEAWGVSFGAPAIAIDKVRGFKDRVVSQLTGGVGQVGRLRKINYIQGMAAFRDSHSLEITLTAGGTDTLQFEHAVIATGSRPACVPGLSIESPRVMDSTSALDLPDIPKSLLVVGGGYIGLELGTVYAALGSKVTVVEMTDGLLPGADRDLVNVLANRVNAMCEAVLLKTKVVSTKPANDGIAVTFEGELPEGVAKEQTFDRVLVSVGRKPNSAVPGLDKTGVKVSARGFIEVDAARTRRRTKRASPSTPSTARTSPSSRWRSRQWSSPIRSWPGAASPKRRRRSRSRTSPSRGSRGRRPAARSRWIALTA
jgi:dihydrolipoyl dehydrogenase